MVATGVDIAVVQGVRVDTTVTTGLFLVAPVAGPTRRPPTSAGIGPVANAEVPTAAMVVARLLAPANARPVGAVGAQADAVPGTVPTLGPSAEGDTEDVDPARRVAEVARRVAVQEETPAGVLAETPALVGALEVVQMGPDEILATGLVHVDAIRPAAPAGLRDATASLPVAVPTQDPATVVVARPGRPATGEEERDLVTPSVTCVGAEMAKVAAGEGVALPVVRPVATKAVPSVGLGLAKNEVLVAVLLTPAPAVVVVTRVAVDAPRPTTAPAVTEVDLVASPAIRPAPLASPAMV